MTKEECARKKAISDHIYYMANRERIKKRTRAYALAHRVQNREYQHAWKLSNPEKVREDNAAYRKRVKEIRRVYNKAYCAKRPGYKASLLQNYRAKKRAAYIENVDAATVYERDMGLCQICGVVVEDGDFHLDHRIPISRGGKHSYANCQTAHASCNFKKSSKLHNECAHLWVRH